MRERDDPAMMFCCSECGRDVEAPRSALGCKILCEECRERLENEVEAAWQKTLKRANEN
jgi:uncharacterized protein YlaI